MIEEILAARELARRNLHDFMKYKFKYYYNLPFDDNWHYGLISEYLQACLNNEIPRLIISEPPSYGKSEQVVKSFIPYAWLKNPNLKFIYTTYGQELTNDNATATRDYIKSKTYQSLGADFSLTLDTANNFKNNKDGRVFSTTLGSAVTGIHANGIIIDDPMKAIEASSQIVRDRVDEYYRSSLLSRLLKHNFIIIIMQRLHIDDLVARVLDREKYEFVNLKALEESKKTYHFKNFSYTREANEPLFRLKHDLKDLEEIKKAMGEDFFKTQYLQEPEIKESGVFEKDKITFISDFEIPTQKDYIIIDPAESTKASADDRAIVCSGLSKNEQEQLLLITKDCLFGKWEIEDFTKNAISMMFRYPDAVVLIELTGGGYTFKSFLEKEIIRLNHQFKLENKALLTNKIVGFTPSKKISKNEQILLLKPYLNLGYFKIKENCLNKEQIIKELLAFNPAKKHNTDNTIDCISKMLVLSEVSAYEKETNANNAKINKTIFKTWRI